MIIDSIVFYIVILLTLVQGLIIGSVIYHLKMVVLPARKNHKATNNQSKDKHSNKTR